MQFTRLKLSIIGISVLLLMACSKTPDFVPIDETTQKGFVVLNGYLKRRGLHPTKTHIDVQIQKNGMLFRWKTQEYTRFYLVTEKDKAWSIQEDKRNPSTP
ncbi:hypothetical protein [Teredinibacter purpureus]|uniref:hypothetical protein n=1 Tax=Teredinibacter purpureus TaxID=2731756 RepID=UPI0005F87579|nr:hypothetical protein [Teredinibacter purpureus]